MLGKTETNKIKQNAEFEHGWVQTECRVWTRLSSKRMQSLNTVEFKENAEFEHGW